MLCSIRLGARSSSLIAPRGTSTFAPYSNLQSLDPEDALVALGVHEQSTERGEQEQQQHGRADLHLAMQLTCPGVALA